MSGRDLRLLIGMMFVSLCLSYCHFLTGPLLVELGGVSPQEAALWMCLIALVNCVFQPWLGNKLDQGNLVLPFLVSAVFTPLGLAGLMSSSLTLTGVVVAIGVFQLGSMTLVTAHRTYTVGQLKDEERDELSSVFFLVFNMAIGISALVAYAFLEDYRIQLLTLDMLSTLAVIFLTFGLVYRRKAQGRLKIVDQAKRGQNFFGVLIKLIRLHPGSLIAILFVEIALRLIIDYLPLLYAHKGAEEAARLVALVLLVNTFTIVVASHPLNRVLRRMTRLQIFSLSALLIACGLAGLPLSEKPWLLALMTVVFSIGEICLARVDMPIVFSMFRPGEEGLAAGFITTLHGAAKVFSPLLAAVLLDLPAEYAALTLLVWPLVSLVFIREVASRHAFP